jgi:hypothetical protein
MEENFEMEQHTTPKPANRKRKPRVRYISTEKFMEIDGEDYQAMFTNDSTLKTNYKDIVKRKLSHEIECKIIQVGTTNTSSKSGKITMYFYCGFKSCRKYKVDQVSTAEIYIKFAIFQTTDNINHVGKITTAVSGISRIEARKDFLGMYPTEYVDAQVMKTHRKI